MIEQLLESRLKPVWRRRWWLTLTWKLATCWALCALVAAALLLGLRMLGWASVLTLPALILGVFVATGIVIVRHRRSKPDLRRLTREIEQRDPELGGRLATALEQKPTQEAPLNFLQHRLIVEAVEKSYRSNWHSHVPWSRLAGAGVILLVAIGFFGLVLATLPLPVKPGASGLLVRMAEIEVTPGDTTLERGSSFIVLARFSEPVPPTAELVFQPALTTPRTQSLVRSLNDPVFGGSLSEVTEDFVYHVEFNGRKSPEYKVKVFEFPRLERADAQLSFPAYTQLEPKRIEDTRRISAVEGTQLGLTLQLNKPVAQAKLIRRGDSTPPILLTTDPERAVASLPSHELTEGGTYDLQLVDAEGRTNKTPSQFVFDVSVNRTPELKLLAPRGDITPSALEEVSFEGSVWDDFGVLAYGLAFSDAEGEPKFIELGQDVPAKEKRTLPHTLRLEEWGVNPDDLVSWFVWADDLGPDGQVRRTRGDLFFAEVRPFDEIFREGQSGGEGQMQQSGGQDGSPTTKLAELQKQIINATWKLERQRPLAKKPQHAKDVGVVTESQSEALDQAKELGDSAEDPRAEMMWGGVIKEMERALTQLEPATNTTVSLATALAAEKAAYQALLKLREREFQVTRSRGQQGGGGGAGEQQRQRQLEQLEFTQNESRYETQRDAQSPQSPERREELQVLNRLQELARRQEDLNERLKELQAALQAADTEKEREELRRQLKRLQEEQQRMLADADELGQRLERPENQSRFAEQRRQLEQTRNELQRASEAASEGATSQALAAGTRAQQQLQQMREQLQQQSSSQFAEELRQMRQEAREITRQQESVAEQLDALQKDNRRSLSDSAAREAVVQELARQQARLTNLVEQATQVSQAAENTEPIVSRQLYDTLRQLSQDESGGAKQMQDELIRRGQMTRGLYDQLQQMSEQGAGQSLELTEQLVREGLIPQADAAEQQARQTLARLQRGVERAAESVLGDDTQALERAQQELNALADQLEREMAQAGGQAPGETPSQQPTASPGQSASPEQSQSPSQAQSPGESSSPGQAPSPGESPSPGQARSPGQGPTPGQAQSPGESQSPGQAQSPGQGQSPSQAQAGQTPGQQPQPGQSPGGSQAGPSSQGTSAQQQASAGNNPGQRLGRERNTGSRDGRGTGPADFDLSNLEQLSAGADRGGGRGTGPILGEDFSGWSDRLREVEEMIDDPELRSQVAAARERARLTRLEYKRDLKKPDWAVVRLQVVKPLVEVQAQIQEELRRRNPGDSLVPIDRDPVPARFSELVRRYYEQLGKDN